MRTRWLLIVALALTCLFGSVAAAYGDAPVTTPAILQQVHFESAVDTLPVYDLNLNPLDPPPAAKWGTISAQHNTGSYGFWCAGSTPSAYPNYPAPTRSQACFAATDTTNYFESWLQYSYIEPSMGLGEGVLANPFMVNWADASQSPTASASQWASPFQEISPVWTTQTLSRNNIEFPKTAGWLRFLFASSADDTSSAQGATIDDVMSTAYEYGPVGSLTAARTSPHSTVSVSWTAAPGPAGAYYRVWRLDVATSTWTQLTADATSATHWTDTNVNVTKAYQYAVQAWEGPVSTSNWGELATSPQVAAAATTTLTGTFAGSATATSAPYKGQLKISGTLTDVDGGPLAGMASQLFVQTSADNVNWTTAGSTVASAAIEPTTGSYSTTITVTGPVYCRLQFGGSGGYLASTSSPSLHVTLRAAITSWPSFSLRVPVKYNGLMRFDGTLGSETGPVTGRSALVYLQSSPDNSTWTTMTASIAENTPGVYTATVDHVTQQGYYYRLGYLGEANYTPSTSAGQPVTYSQATQLTFNNPTYPITESTTTPAYGGAVTFGATLYCGDNGSPAAGRTSVVVQAFKNAGMFPFVTAPATEDSPGHYTATVTGITDTSGVTYNFYFAQDAQYGGNTKSANLPAIGLRPAAIGFSNVMASPSTPISGQGTTVSADLLAETGAPVSSSNATVALLRSDDGMPNGSSWTTVQAGIADSPSGHYAVAVPNITSHGSFRFTVSSLNSGAFVVPSGSATSAAAEVTAAPNPATTLSGTFADGSTAATTVAYGAITKITGTLRDSGGVALFGHAADVAVQSSPNGTSSWTTAGPSVASSAVESITAHGSYEVLVTTNNLTTTYYRLSFGGAGGLSPSQSPYALPITGQLATTSWTSAVLSAATIQYGDSASVGATLSASTGPVTGRASMVTLLGSPTGSAWTTVSAVVSEDRPAHYSVALASPPASRYYRFHFAGDTGLAVAPDSASALLTVNAASASWSGLPSSPVSYEFGAQSSLAGALSAQGPLGGQAGNVVLQSSPTGSSAWTTTSVTVAEDAPGHYSAVFAPSGTGAYYRLSYAGSAGAYLATASPAVRFVSTATGTSWSSVSVPTNVAYDGSTTFSAVLASNTPVPGQAARVQLQLSADGSSNWVATGTVTEGPAGTYSATLTHLKTPGTVFYRLSFAGDSPTPTEYLPSDSATRAVTVARQRTGWIGMKISPTNGVWAGIQPVTISGSLEGSTDGPLANAPVVLLSSPVSGQSSVWTTESVSVQTSGGLYSATLSSVTTDTYFQLAYAGDSLRDPAVSAAQTVSVSAPTLQFKADSVTFTPALAWNNASTISAQVSVGASLVTTDLGTGGSVVMEKSVNGGATWSQVKTATMDSSGWLSARDDLTPINTWYRLHYAKTDQYPDFTTLLAMAATPKMYLTTPGTPLRVTHKKYFYISGRVSRVPIASRTVTLRAYHKETQKIKGKKVAVWVYRASTTARAGAGGSYYSYKVKMKLSQTGSWRVLAKVSDAYNPAFSTGYRYFSAK